MIFTWRFRRARRRPAGARIRMMGRLTVWLLLGLVGPGSAAAARAAQAAVSQAPHATLLEAWRHFYSGRFEVAADLTRALEVDRPDDLAVSELRSSALLFQLKRLLEPKGRKVPVRNCAPCPELIEAFTTHFRQARVVARAQVTANPDDLEARFYLGKLNLNYIWLQLGPLGKRTGWNEYWEARHSLDEVLLKHPEHVRARVARAWIDYIVDTRMPWGTEWMLGGGDKKRGLRAIREAVATDGEYFARTEARFALWEMLMRERNVAGAVELARQLAMEFPDNREIAAFLDEHDRHPITR